MYRLIGFGIGFFELGIDRDTGIGAMVKEAVRQGATESFMEKNEHDAHPDTLIRKVVAIMPAISFDKVSGFHFSDVVAQLP